MGQLKQRHVDCTPYNCDHPEDGASCPALEQDTEYGDADITHGQYEHIVDEIAKILGDERTLRLATRNSLVNHGEQFVLSTLGATEIYVKPEYRREQFLFMLSQRG